MQAKTGSYEAGSLKFKYPRLITRDELASFLGVSARTVDRLVTQGRIERIVVSKGAIRFDLEDVLRRLKGV